MLIFSDLYKIPPWILFLDLGDATRLNIIMLKLPASNGASKGHFHHKNAPKIEGGACALFRGPTKKLFTFCKVTKVTFLGTFPDGRQGTLTLDFDPLKILQ